MNRIGSAIRRIREEKGMSEKQLSKKIGVSDSYLADVEEGRKIPTEDLVKRIRKALAWGAEEELESVGPADRAQRTAQPARPQPPAVPDGPPAPAWEAAFGALVAEIPVFDEQEKNVLEKRLHVVENRKVLGCPPEELYYVRLEGDGLEMDGLKPGEPRAAAPHVFRASGRRLPGPDARRRGVRHPGGSVPRGMDRHHQEAPPGNHAL